MLCQDCQNRNSCLKLCPEAEAYVDQDWVKLREKTIGLPHYGKPMEWRSDIYITEREREILELLEDGLARKDVCQSIGMSRGALRFVLHILRRKMDDGD